MICSNLSGLNLDGEISPAVGELKFLLTMYCSSFIFLFRHLSYFWPRLCFLIELFPQFFFFLGGGGVGIEKVIKFEFEENCVFPKVIDYSFYC